MSSSSKSLDDFTPDLEVNQNNEQPKVTPKSHPPMIHRLFTPLIPSKKVPLIPSDEERTTFPAYRTNMFSRVFMVWLLPLYAVGYLRTITQEDLWLLGNELKLETSYVKFKENFDAVSESKQYDKSDKPEAKTTVPPSAIPRTIFNTFQSKYVLSIILKNIAGTLMALVPLVTKYLISFVQDRTRNPDTVHAGKGVGFAIGIALMIMVRALFDTQADLISFHIGAQSRTLLTKMILEKSFLATVETKHNFPQGTLLSFLSNDITRLGSGVAQFPELTAFFIPAIIAIVLLLINMKASALAGIGVYFLILACIVAPMQVMLKLRDKANVYTDKRVELVREVVESIKVIKFYSWEDAYEKMIKVARAGEIDYVLKIQLLTSIIISLALSASPIISMVGVVVYHSVTNGKDPAIIFSSLILFNILNLKMVSLSMAVGDVTDGINACRRLVKYLEAPVESQEALETYFDDELIRNLQDVAVQVVNGEFQWEKFEELSEDEKEKSDQDKKEKQEAKRLKKKSKERKKQGLPPLELEIKPLEYKTILKDVNLTIHKGEFIVITGPIGSGKSSLLAALSGALIHKKTGRVGINGSSLLCGATPWIQNNTVRENILFGSPYEEIKYTQVVSACCLQPDIEQLPAGDATEIGERGITLSGGQKARLQLARVVYANPDILLLDDVLSAVDANVGKSITDSLLLGLVKDKTRVLATHQLSLLSKADRVIFVNGDGTIDVGTKSELKSRNLKFCELLEFNKSQQEEKSKKPSNNAHNTDIEGKREIKRLTEGDLYTDEERVINAIPLSTYIQYIQSGQGVLGASIIPLILIGNALSVFCNLFANVWLTFWIENKFHFPQGKYIGLYILFTFAAVLFAVFEFGLESYVIVQSSKVLNLKAVSKLLHAPMSFFDTTPLGRVINRFSKDTNSLDNEIGDRIKACVHMIGLCIGAVILSIIYVPWFVIVIPFAVIILVGCVNFYQATSREVKRLEAINRSFVLNNFNECISGVDTIKLFKSQDRFIKKNDEFCDRLNEVYFVVLANQRWISLTLDSLGIILLFIVTILVVCGTFDVSASAAGLLIYYMNDFSGMLSAILSQYVDIENDMNSVERLMYYANDLVQEADYRSDKAENKSKEKWPEFGAIQFKDVSLRYRDGLPLVLKDLSIEVKAGEKIGICGRTGAGKSSLMAALYRLSELVEGSVIIDGVDISNIGLHDLRSNLSIIPQDSVLLQGTIRRNLDPFNRRTDDDLWDALRRSNMIKAEDLEAVKSETDKEKYHKFHLDSQVLSNGSNFSMGERQLIALARALVRQCKILIMDEATSSVDYETDHLIQTTIATEFKDCTILCIAHRLKTIIGYDKILVLEKGELAEFDNPLKLFDMGQDSLFYQMCQNSGITREEFR